VTIEITITDIETTKIMLIGSWNIFLCNCHIKHRGKIMSSYWSICQHTEHLH